MRVIFVLIQMQVPVEQKQQKKHLNMPRKSTAILKSEFSQEPMKVTYHKDCSSATPTTASSTHDDASDGNGSETVPLSQDRHS